MSEVFNLKIMTPESVFIENEIISLIVPGKDGFLGIQKNHIELVGLLNQGIVSFKEKNEQWKHIFVDKGCISVTQKQSLLLVQKAHILEKVNEIEIKEEIQKLQTSEKKDFFDQIEYLENILKSLKIIEKRNQSLNN